MVTHVANTVTRLQLLRVEANGKLMKFLSPERIASVYYLISSNYNRMSPRQLAYVIGNLSYVIGSSGKIYHIRVILSTSHDDCLGRRFSVVVAQGEHF